MNSEGHTSHKQLFHKDVIQKELFELFQLNKIQKQHLFELHQQKLFLIFIQYEDHFSYYQ